jgi:hypothetical protein
MAERRWLRTLTAAELRAVSSAVVLLPAVAAGIRLRGLRWVRDRLAPRRRRSRRLAAVLVADSIPPDRLAHLVTAAAQQSPWKANCLQRSVVLWWALEVQGRRAEVCVGVRRQADSAAPDFHAWVELDGRVLNDEAEVRSSFHTFEPASGASISGPTPR